MNEELKNQIVSLRQGGSSIRAIGRQLGLPRSRVAKVLAEQARGRAEGGLAGELPRAKRKRRNSWASHARRFNASSSMRGAKWCRRWSMVRRCTSRAADLPKRWYASLKTWRRTWLSWERRGVGASTDSGGSRLLKRFIVPHICQ